MARPPEHLLLDLRSGQLDDSHWPHANRPVPLGSIVKPFVALAHGPPFPELFCARCWKPDGHGRITLIEALAQSCNSYFLQLAAACSYDRMARTTAAYGLPLPALTTPECWIGLGGGWFIAPSALLRAYGELAARAAEPGPAQILAGMRLSARHGTARTIHAEVFAKTGTASCSHTPKGNGDGFAVALFPLESPRHALLATLHDAPGSEAARAAGALIRAHAG